MGSCGLHVWAPLAVSGIELVGLLAWVWCMRFLIALAMAVLRDTCMLRTRTTAACGPTLRGSASTMPLTCPGLAREAMFVCCRVHHSHMHIC